MNKAFVTATTKSVNKDLRIVQAFASRPILDRDQEIIKAGAWDLDEFRQNPVLLLSHDYRSLPIGKVLDIRDTQDGLIFSAQYAQTPKADEVWQLTKGGFLKSFSVGFQPLEWTEGKGEQEPRRTYTKVKLLEISVVSVPANPFAVVTDIKSTKPDEVLLEIVWDE